MEVLWRLRDIYWHLSLYPLVLVAKLLAVIGYVAAVAGVWWAPQLADQRKLLHRVASPALVAIWLLGASLALLQGRSLGQGWIVAGWSGSVASNLALHWAVRQSARSRGALAAVAVPFAATVALMVLRPEVRP